MLLSSSKSVFSAGNNAVLLPSQHENTLFLFYACTVHTHYWNTLVPGEASLYWMTDKPVLDRFSFSKLKIQTLFQSYDDVMIQDVSHLHYLFFLTRVNVRFPAPSPGVFCYWINPELLKSVAHVLVWIKESMIGSCDMRSISALWRERDSVLYLCISVMSLSAR